MADILKQAKNQPVYNQHRMFAQNGEKTITQKFIEELPQRVNVSLRLLHEACNDFIEGQDCQISGVVN